MPYKEPDYETVILLKLGAMEALLKSFMAGLERPFQRKGGEIRVYAEITGRIHWYMSALQPVENGAKLCRINSTERPGEFRDIFYTAGLPGILFIEQGVDERELVSMGDLIATIVQESDFYPE